MQTNPTSPVALPPKSWLQSSWAALLSAFHVYANWLVGISWKRFVALAVLLLIAVNILDDLPPFSWTYRETIENARQGRINLPTPPKIPELPPFPTLPPAPQPPGAAPEEPAKGKDSSGGVQITIDAGGVRITPKAGASAPAGEASGEAGGAKKPAIVIRPDAQTQAEIRAALDEARIEAQEARRAAEEALREARETAEETLREASEALAEYQRGVAELRGQSGESVRVHRVRLGEGLVNLTVLWILLSIVIKITYKGRLQAEVKAAQATETAEAESLKRQVVEARMAAMQAQVEPHFLFNTLASIDHLIETAPARASQMQKNLIALLRASMPTMREASTGGTRDLGREVAVIRPYLEILKVRMEERLETQIDIPEGLYSAAFPPMMIQGLVENAIKHGLEPKPEGGSLHVKAEIVHGKLCVTVADTGVGFGQAATRGTGVGLANIRERLQLLYGNRAALAVSENKPSGTVVSVTVPYEALDAAPQSAGQGAAPTGAAA